MRVKDIMTKSVVGIAPDATVAEALDAMTRSHVSGLPVIDAMGSLVGLISEADFLRRAELGTALPERGWIRSLFSPGKAAEVYARAHAKHVDQIMSRNVATIEENASLAEALDIMEKRRVKRLPVVEGDRVIGMLSRADFVHALAVFVREPYEEKIVADAEIKQQIEVEMQAQSWAPVASIDVAVDNGVVQLRGILTNERERMAIHALVENIVGVREVHDHLVWAEPMSGFVNPSPEDAVN